MANTIGDLNSHLFDQIERLSKEGISPEELEKEVSRSEAMVKIADKISGNADLQLKAAKLFADHGQGVLPHLPQIGGQSE